MLIGYPHPSKLPKNNFLPIWIHQNRYKYEMHLQFSISMGKPT